MADEAEDYASYPRLKLNSMRTNDLLVWLENGQLRSGRLNGFAEGWKNGEWESAVIVAGKRVSLDAIVSRRRPGAPDIIYLHDALQSTPSVEPQ